MASFDRVGNWREIYRFDSARQAAASQRRKLAEKRQDLVGVQDAAGKKLVLVILSQTIGRPIRAGKEHDAPRA